MARKLTMDGYVRVSRVAGREGESFISPEQQREAIEGYAKARGITIARMHEPDLDQSGRKMRWPSFDAMMARVVAGETGGVIVAKVDRFGRTLVGALEALKVLEDHGAAFVSVAEGFDSSTPAGKRALRMMLLFGEFELDRITESWADAQRRAVARGVYPGRGTPFGYRKRDDGRLTIVAAEARVVRELFERRGRFESWTGLAQWLNDAHPRDDARRWIHQDVKRMIPNRVYVGEVRTDDYVNRDAHQPIVTLAAWEAANAVEGGRAPTRGKPLPLLAGMIRCAGCRYGMRMLHSPRRHGPPVAGYRCPQHHTAGDCPAPAYIRADEVERFVVGNFILMYGEVARHASRPDRTRVDEAETALEDLQRRLAEVMADDQARELAHDAWLADIERRQRLVTEAEERLEAARQAVTADESRPIALAEDWAEANAATRRSLLGRAIDTIYVLRASESVLHRVWIRWSGEDNLERPGRGGDRYSIQPVPWPAELGVEADVVQTWTEGGIDYSAATRPGTREAMMIANTPRWVWGRVLAPPPEDLGNALTRIAGSV